MIETPSEIRALVRRDILVFVGGLLVAVTAIGLLAASWLGLVGSRVAATTVLIAAVTVGFGCFVWWRAGPIELRRDRYIVLVPVFLISFPALVSLRDLGAGLAVVLFSSLVGFSAAIAAGYAIAGRRR